MCWDNPRLPNSSYDVTTLDNHGWGLTKFIEAGQNLTITVRFKDDQ